ncbi:hypothetical protein [Agromyces marinus]|uniref:ABC transporter permease n=1 Tax=Agromyces marinus TaxID=1389020 RepID=A0ABN6YBF2_9MICO|nr:hypothetical protein [Agromyces marinus]UIP57444.1 hypothetical protein DSM26151_03020 [Agromyces marinus]BDZ54429.1 hypothetical protein GCM10025870_15020 [Agromyces marinus]
MTETVREHETKPSGRGRGIRLVVFRILMVLIALLHLVGFGAWRGVLAPWVVLPDDVDHGWERTPELHRLADGAAGAIFVAVAAAALVLAVRPRGSSGLAAWLASALALTGGFSWLSALIQGHDDVLSTLVFSVVWIGLVAAVFVWLHPEGRDVLRGGSTDADRPARSLRLMLGVITVAALVGLAATVVWRASGGTFEDPQEDDLFSLVYFCTLWALGGFLAGRGRAGWRALAVILLAGAAYAVVGGLSIAIA